MIEFGLSLISFGKIATQAVLSWLSRRSLAEIGCLILCITCGVLLISNRIEKRHAHKLQTQLSKVVQARLNDRAAYSKAQAAAATQNKAQVQRIEQQQQKVTDDVETRYRADLARLRAEQLRASTAAPSSAPSKPGSPPLSAAPSGPRCEALPLPPAELLRAQETELQLNALIDWTLQQSAIDPNK